MKTLNRQTASARPTRSQVESLNCVVQKLWATQPPRGASPTRGSLRPTQPTRIRSGAASHSCRDRRTAPGECRRSAQLRRTTRPESVWRSLRPINSGTIKPPRIAVRTPAPHHPETPPKEGNGTMSSLLILLVWMALGIAASVFWRQPGEPRFAWAPMAITFGPLWALIANERDEASQALPSSAKSLVEVKRPRRQDVAFHA